MENNALVVELLIQRGWQISFAESCTGGLAVARLVDVPNASRVLSASFVTYTEEAKTRLAGVRPETLSAFGVVSQAVAGEMAQGAAKANGAQVGVGISGIAGPSGGTPEIPVGTVCFGFSINGKLTTQTCHFENRDRQGVRLAAVDHVFHRLAELLQDPAV